MADSVLASHVAVPCPPAPVLVVHGGAYGIPSESHQAHLEGCRRAADVGWSVLRPDGSALEAVETAARLLEDDSLREDILDLALIQQRHGESSRPFREYLAKRGKQGG